MAELEVGRLLRIFVAEDDRWHGMPLYVAIVDRLRREGVAGASVFRGEGGFGTHREIHAAKLFALAQKLPVVIEAVDDAATLERVLPAIEEMVAEGLVTLERVEYKRFAGRSPAS